MVTGRPPDRAGDTPPRSGQHADDPREGTGSIVVVSRSPPAIAKAAERLLCALPFAVTAPPLRGFWNARGVRLAATDVDWSRGKGPEARAPAEAVLMVLAGRRGVAGDLAADTHV
jgi:hypothetical protein